MARLSPHLRELRKDGREYIICGDWNIAHTKGRHQELARQPQNFGFLPEERAWMDKLFGPLGWIDAFRVVNQSPDEYSWWSNRGQAWANNVGWRIDYQVVTPGLRERIQAPISPQQALLRSRAADFVDYDLDL